MANFLHQTVAQSWVKTDRDACKGYGNLGRSRVPLKHEHSWKDWTHDTCYKRVISDPILQPFGPWFWSQVSLIFWQSIVLLLVVIGRYHWCECGSQHEGSNLDLLYKMKHFRADWLNHFRNVVTKMELEIEKTMQILQENSKRRWGVQNFSPWN